MLEDHSDALSLPSDVRRTSDFQKSERNSACKLSLKRTYAVRHKTNEWQISPKALAPKGLSNRLIGDKSIYLRSHNLREILIKYILCIKIQIYISQIDKLYRKMRKNKNLLLALVRSYPRIVVKKAYFFAFYIMVKPR